jgi:hypothetical protein
LLTIPPARAETSAFAPYEWEDPLKVESTLINEEERSIMFVERFLPTLDPLTPSNDALTGWAPLSCEQGDGEELLR